MGGKILGLVLKFKVVMIIGGGDVAAYNFLCHLLPAHFSTPQAIFFSVHVEAYVYFVHESLALPAKRQSMLVLLLEPLPIFSFKSGVVKDTYISNYENCFLET